MSLVRDIIENERGLHTDTVATDKEIQTTTGYRNHIIDGSFSICQVSDTPYTGNGYSHVDMWKQTNNTLERTYDSSGQSYAKCTCDDVTGENYIVSHIENVIKFLNKTVTISFDFDSPDNLTENSVVLYFIDADGNTVPFEKTFNCTTERTRYSFTFDLTTTATPVDGEPLRVDIYGQRLGEANNNGKVYNVYNVQLEFGDVATPFEIRPYGLELSLCQRYYEVGRLQPFLGQTDIYSASGRLATFDFRVIKRAIPTIVNLGNYNVDIFTRIDIDGFSMKTDDAADKGFFPFSVDARF